MLVNWPFIITCTFHMVEKRTFFFSYWHKSHNDIQNELWPTLEASIFLIHLMAWPWGSTMSGHLLEEVTMTPFSVEKASLGNPWMFQSRTCVGLAMNSQKLKFGAHGIPSFRTWWIQWMIETLGKICVCFVSCIILNRFQLTPKTDMI